MVLLATSGGGPIGHPRGKVIGKRDVLARAAWNGSNIKCSHLP
jgi:hypothetical protein